MAIDQAIAEAAAAGESLSTLRFYRWNPPTVSLGRHQPFEDIDTDAIATLGYEIVRRPTGGRAILHTDELTYSVAGSERDPLLEGGVMDAYLRLSNALVTGLGYLQITGIDKAAGNVRAGPNISAACFEVPSAYEITAGGRKLLGSAQSRRAGYVLQHGSLPLVGDITRLIDVLALAPEKAVHLRTELEAHALTLAQALGVEDDSPAVAFDVIWPHLRRGFEEQLQVSFNLGALTPAELRRSALLIREQYANEEWIRHR